jgi:hypothetical protein
MVLRRSFDGFLAEGEKLKEVIRKDREQLAKLSLSHSQVASLLRTVLSQVELKRSSENVLQLLLKNDSLCFSWDQ